MSSPKVYTLLVGIDQYQQVGALSGCVHDVTAVEKYLQQRTDFDVDIKKLTDSKAIKAGITDAFKTHLGKASKQDTVLFYYSGHGTQETADELWQETDGALECLVCYDGDVPHISHFLMTDKELRYLIQELYQKTKAHIVTIFDCCHSGDNTRNGALMMAGSDGNQIRERRVKYKGANFFPKRAWEDFIFSDQFNEADISGKEISLFLPEGVHVQIAACESDQTALEINSEGVFTKTLLKTLSDCGGNISYNTLRSRIRQYMRASFEQTPRIYAPIDADQLLGKGFLNKPISPQTIFSEATQDKKGKWQINVGALHGVNAQSNITLTDPERPNQPISATIKSKGIFIDYCLIDTPSLIDQKVYKAHVSGLLFQELNLEVENRDATPEQAALLITSLQQQAAGGFSFGGEQSAKSTQKDSGNATPADYTLHFNSGEVYLTLPAHPFQPLFRPLPLLKKTPSGHEDTVLVNQQPILETLQHISRWHFIKNLENQVLPENFPTQPILIEIKDASTGQPLDISDGKTDIDYEKSGSEWRRSIEIKITNTTDQDLYICAAYLFKNFTCYLNYIPQPVHLLQAGKSILLGQTSKAGKKKNVVNLQLDAVDQEYNWAETWETLKFIISTTEFDSNALSLESLPAPLTTADRIKGFSDGMFRSPVLDEEVQFSGWVTQTLHLRFKNPVHNIIPAAVLKSLLEWEETAYFAAGLYCDIENDAHGQPTIWKLKKGIKVPEGEKSLVSDIKLWLGNKIETAQRNKRYNNLKQDPKRVRIVAEGDSWFQYPILLQDTLDQLYKRYAIKSFAEAGDTLANYLKKKEYLNAIETENAEFFLVSGGGNDVLGEEFQHFLRLTPDPDDTSPKRYLHQKFFDQLDKLDQLYEELFNGLLQRYPDLHILVHCYDYIIPVDLDNPENKKKSSWSGKYMFDKKIAPQSVREDLIIFILNEFAQRLEKLAQKAPFLGKVSFVDTRGLVNRSSWFDEIHPIDEGFELVAAKFISEIERIRSKKKSLTLIG
jgi:hypothetical protein